VLSILLVTFPFFALVLAGYIAARRRMLPLEAIAGLNGFVLFFALPCMLYRFGATTPIAQLLDASVFFTWLLWAPVGGDAHQLDHAAAQGEHPFGGAAFAIQRGVLLELQVIDRRVNQVKIFFLKVTEQRQVAQAAVLAIRRAAPHGLNLDLLHPLIKPEIAGAS